MNIAFDSHKHYTLCSVATERGQIVEETRIDHQRGSIQEFLFRYPAGEAVAVETIGNWYWIVDEIEAAGHRPLLVHARRAKLMLGNVNKTDRLDVRGLNRLQQTGTLPTVWIPPGELRAQRDLSRTRIYLVAIRTRLKNRIHATLDKYALSLSGVQDVFGVRCRERLGQLLARLPEPVHYTAREQLAYVEQLDQSIAALDKEIEKVFALVPEISLLRSIPGIGRVLSITVNLEVGEVSRFTSAQALASYAGTGPRVHVSGGRIRYGQLRSDVNRYLKWAYAEAANSLVINQRLYPDRHVTRLYRRIKARKGHQKAIGAVSRHLAEATYWILSKQAPYQEPLSRQQLSTRV